MSPAIPFPPTMQFNAGVSPDSLSARIAVNSWIGDGDGLAANYLLSALPAKFYGRTYYVTMRAVELDGSETTAPVVSASVESIARATLADPAASAASKAVAQRLIDAMPAA